MENRHGLLRLGARFVNRELAENRQLRVYLLVLTLLIILTCIGLAAFDIAMTLPKGETRPISPRFFTLLYLPVTFFFYDRILGEQPPRSGIQAMLLDLRLPNLIWQGLKLCLGLIVPSFIVGVAVGFTASLVYGQKSPATALLIVGWALLGACLSFFVMARELFLPIAVALRRKRILRTSFGETRGKIWRIFGALFLPWTVALAASIGMELLGKTLERNLGFVGLAPWFLFCACLTAWLTCLDAAVLAMAYRRVVLETDAEPAAEAFGLDPQQTPPAAPPV